MIANNPVVKLPLGVILGSLAVCVSPFLLNVLFGIDFGNNRIPFDATKLALANEGGSVNDVFHALGGAFTHTILEWSAFCCALFVAIFALSNYSITKDVTTPVIGIALFCSGCVAAFHTLAADRLIHGVADATNLVPFTWAISRVFNALIMIIGVSLFLFRKKEVVASNQNEKGQKGIMLILFVGVSFACLAYIVIHLCATSENLPQTMYPDALITRPWDVATLVLFLIAGVVVYPLFYKKYKSIFAYALILSAVPEVITEMHMAFGSKALFDNHFNIAHFLKIIAYVIPLLGLLFDYIYTYQEELRVIETLKQTELKLKTEQLSLAASNKELQQFAYVASHDLQEPLRVVGSYMELLEKRYADKLDEKGLKYIDRAVEATIRMSTLINDLLMLTKLESKGGSLESINTTEMMEAVVRDMEVLIKEKGAIINYKDLLDVSGDPTQLHQLFQNLINNGLKFSREGVAPIIDITAKVIGSKIEFAIKDNGIGMEKKYLERIFVIFQRLHGRGEYSGTGIGLALCKKIVERHGGTLRVESQPDKGSTFYFTLPKSKT